MWDRVSDTTTSAEVGRMRNFEFIHSTEDVHRVLWIAAKLGLIIRDDSPAAEPHPKMVSTAAFNTLSAGSFMLYRPSWVLGPLQFEEITSGYNSGKYFQNPATNYSAVTAYFGGERLDENTPRLGNGDLSRDVDWYRPSDQTIHPAPPEVEIVFNEIRREIDTGRRLRGGVHNYAVLEGASKKLDKGSHLPPFDYIEWPVESKAH